MPCKSLVIGSSGLRRGDVAYFAIRQNVHIPPYGGKAFFADKLPLDTMPRPIPRTMHLFKRRTHGSESA